MDRSPRTLVMLSAATVLVAAGCIGRDTGSPVEPARIATGAIGTGSADVLGAANFVTDTLVTVIVVDPTVTSAYQIGGGHRLWIQAGGICALGSTYGIDTWDTACDIATTPIVITARSWNDTAHRPHVDFSPQLRFAPLDGRRAAAELYLKDKIASLDPRAVILYCAGDSCVDESLSDSSLATMRDKQQGFVYRRIKHFSGYEVSTGRSDSTSDLGGVP